MSTSKFFVENDKFNILKKLEEILLNHKRIIIKQQPKNKDSIVAICKLKSFSGMNEYISIEITGGSLDFTESIDMLIQSESLDIYFQTKNFSINDNDIKIDLPKQIKISEYRDNTRYYLKDIDVNEDLLTTFEIEAKQLEKIYLKGNFEILNFSKTGAALLIPAKKANFVDIGDTILIKRLFNLELKNSLHAEVINKFTHNLDFRIGIHFTETIPPEVLENILLKFGFIEDGELI